MRRQKQQKGKFLNTEDMFDFITVPLVVGLACWTFYGFFDLAIRKGERMKLIDKQ